MNWKLKFAFSIALLGLLCLMLPGSLRADTVYTYTGNAYTTCTGVYATSGTCAGPYALTVTFDVAAGTPMANLTNVGITADVTTFSFTDGSGLDITNSNASGVGFAVSTDASGNITYWYIDATYQMFTTTELVTTNITSPFDASLIEYAPPGFSSGYGENSVDPGQWTSEVVGTPEPSSFLQLGTGLLGLIGFSFKKAIS